MIVRQRLHYTRTCSSKHSSASRKYRSRAVGLVTSPCRFSAVVCQPAAKPAYRQRLRLPVTHIQSISNENSSSGSSDSSSDSSSSPRVSVAVSTPSPAAAAAAGGKDAILARIAQAKAYKQGTAPSSSSSSDSSTSSSSSSGGSDIHPQAPDQQESLQQQYLDQLRQQQQQLAAQGSSYSTYIQKSSQTRSDQDSNLEPSDLDPLSAVDDPGSGPRRPPAREDFYSNNVPSVVDLMRSAPKTEGRGSADEAADFLRGVLETTADPRLAAMRPEEVTTSKETAARQRGAEIITAFPEDFSSSSSSGSSPSAAAAAGSSAADAAAEWEDEKYKPKVTTWGLFPRPSNISEAYGGGRNIRPGQALETPEQKAKREAEYAAALQMYKKATFTDSLSEEELAVIQQRYNNGLKLFKRGDLQGALVIFDEVREQVPLKSKLGGFSTLQAAVCYDTLGQARKAEALYKRIRGHPTTEVSRKAKQLVFGFQAMSFLKTEGLSYAVKKEDYLKYFRRAADRNRLYVASEEEKEADQAEAAKAAAVALGVVLGPVVLIGALVAGSKIG